MKTIKSNKYANTFEGYDPFTVNWSGEEEKAQSMDERSLLGALKDAIEASQVSVNSGKYFDQASIYRKELMSRGMTPEQQDQRLKGIPSLHSTPQNIAYTITHKKAQLDVVECSLCNKTKNRDQMANGEVCLDCEDQRQISNCH